MLMYDGVLEQGFGLQTAMSDGKQLGSLLGAHAFRVWLGLAWLRGGLGLLLRLHSRPDTEAHRRQASAHLGGVCPKVC